MSDTRRWWIVSGNGMVNHYYEAPTGRSALSRFRADLIDGFRSGDFTKADAIRKVRALDLAVLAGPLSTDQAMADELGWSWAEAICDSNHAAELIPSGPATRDEAIRRLGQDRAERWESMIRFRYEGTQP